MTRRVRPTTYLEEHPDHPESRAPFAQYVRGEATREAYGYARGRWLAWARTQTSRRARKPYQRELAWWRAHTKMAREGVPT